MKVKISAIILSFVLISSCSFFDGFDEIPMYLSFSDDVNLTTRSDEGADTEGIFAVSVFADGFNIGVFDLPAEVPVLGQGEDTDISVFGVVRNNAQADNSVAYNFYEPIQFVRPFSAGENVPVDLDFNYRDNINFLYIEDFEGQHRIIENLDDNPDNAIVQSTDARNGSFSGSITSSDDNPFFEKATLNTFLASDINNTLAYLELDYKSEVPFRIGILGIIGNQGQRLYKLQVSPSDDWNKLYLDLTEEILANNFTGFKLLFSNLPAEDDFGTVMLDNIKLITF
jgi:hypothetical protein